MTTAAAWTAPDPRAVTAALADHIELNTQWDHPQWGLMFHRPRLYGQVLLVLADVPAADWQLAGPWVVLTRFLELFTDEPTNARDRAQRNMILANLPDTFCGAWFQTENDAAPVAVAKERQRRQAAGGSVPPVQETPNGHRARIVTAAAVGGQCYMSVQHLDDPTAVKTMQQDGPQGRALSGKIPVLLHRIVQAMTAAQPVH